MTIPVSLPRVLCIGVDVTWWGGGRQPGSCGETIISAALDETALDEIGRIDLTKYPNPRSADPTEPNFDADGAALCTAILETIGRHPGVDHVVVALDAPLECCERIDQPARRKAVARGEYAGSKRRQVEDELGDYMRERVPEERAQWNLGLRIQSGSPIPCRIARVVERLRTVGAADLSPYRYGSAASPRGVVEVFPSEAIWALGIQGAYGVLDSKTVRKYKSKRSRWLSPSEARAIARCPLQGFLASLLAGGFPVEIANEWIEKIVDAAAPGSTTHEGLFHKSKSFDDAIDSGIAFLTAVCCALGQFHEWGAATEDMAAGADGTIVGPGRFLIPQA